jgi:RHS repeat-associated protein
MTNMLFQGQEMLEDLGLKWNSFAWRNYDPALGRFFSIDPLAEKYSFMSPYQFSSNQPVHAPELEGMESADHEYDYWENDYDPHEYDWQTYNVWGYSVLNDDETEQIITPTSYISKITIEAKPVPRKWSWGIDRNDIMDVVSYAPAWRNSRHVSWGKRWRLASVYFRGGFISFRHSNNGRRFCNKSCSSYNSSSGSGLWREGIS